MARPRTDPVAADAEAALLSRAANVQGLSAPELSLASGVALPTVRNALAGERWDVRRKGEPSEKMPTRATDDVFLALVNALGIPEAEVVATRPHLAGLVGVGSVSLGAEPRRNALNPLEDFSTMELLHELMRRAKEDL